MNDKGRRGMREDTRPSPRNSESTSKILGVRGEIVGVVIIVVGTEKASDSPSMSHRVYWDYKACRGRRAGRRDLFELFKLDTKLNACSARVQVMTALAYKW